MGVKSATLAGTSLGGWISARIAARHPERVDRLSLIASAGLTAHPSVMHNLKTLTERASLVSGREGVKVRLDFVLKNPEALTERSEEHTSELQSLMRISYADFCLKKK